MQYVLFYILESEDISPVPNTTLSGDYSTELWKPKIYRLAPENLLNLSFLSRSFMHYLKLFQNTDYSVFIVRHRKEMAHYSVVQPGFFKLPFMAKNDLCIGPCVTYQAHQRRGIALYVIQKILDLYKKQGRKFWYAVREENNVSRQFAEKAGFTLYGRGVRKKRFGIKALSILTIEEEYS